MPETFLAFDFGTKYIGIAVGQAITQTATPLITLKARQGIPQWDQVQKIITEWEPHGLVVGLALQPDGSDSATSLKARQFGDSLRKRFKLPVHFVEERLTSVAASHILKQQHHYSKDTDSDAMAAAIILESFLNRTKEFSLHATPQSTV
ncbi:Holliday junction resolvase RuvX [Candidatus Berkiella aquae]|nr:Holliday junction resolvase RuvX [Candidatus Berkiella aquae]MCS5712598.1 Holliday junction resolvase RuvX [Candidatus Berkiella aquae]